MFKSWLLWEMLLMKEEVQDSSTQDGYFVNAGYLQQLSMCFVSTKSFVWLIKLILVDISAAVTSFTTATFKKQGCKDCKWLSPRAPFSPEKRAVEIMGQALMTICCQLQPFVWSRNRLILYSHLNFVVLVTRASSMVTQAAARMQTNQACYGFCRKDAVLTCNDTLRTM